MATRHQKNTEELIRLEQKQLYKKIESEDCERKLHAKIIVWLKNEYGENNCIIPIYYEAIFRILKTRFSPLTFESLQESFEEFEALKYFFKNKQVS